MSVEKQDQWSGRIGFIIAAVGSAVGLGNLWKFPYITYENGGGAFVIMYLVAIMIVGFPILLAEMVIGRQGHSNIFHSFKDLSQNNPFWKIFAIFLLATGTIILSYYSVVAGWTLEYLVGSITKNLAQFDQTTIGNHFGTFVGNGTKQIIYHTIFMLVTSLVIIKGTQTIEPVLKVLMPILAVLIVVIMAISIYNYGAGDSLKFLFSFDASKITGHAILEAVGHAFFTLSLGMGVMIIYGSYLPSNTKLIGSAFWIALFDTLIALCACMMMYPIIFGTNMDLSSSASMLFTALTVQFNSLPGGHIVSAVFYTLVAFAALSSTVSLLEAVASAVTQELKISRVKAVALTAGLIWLFGIASALSNGGSEFFTGLKVMDRLDYLASNWGLTIGGALIALFAGWVLKAEELAKALHLDGIWLTGWLFLVRFVSPLCVVIVIIYKVNNG